MIRVDLEEIDQTVNYLDTICVINKLKSKTSQCFFHMLVARRKS